MQKTLLLLIAAYFISVNTTLYAQATAGPDQEFCGDSTTLQAVDPYPNTGYWTVVSGEADIHYPTNYNTYTSNLAEGENILEWSVTDGVNIWTDQVSLTSHHYPHVEFEPGRKINRLPDTEIKFVNYSDQNLIQYIWDWGDGSLPEIQLGYVVETYHYFIYAGTYIVSLTAYSEAYCESVWTDTITILPPCPVSYKEPTLVARGCEDLMVELRAQTFYADIFEWKPYGDELYPDSVFHEEDLIYTYTEPGVYTPVLRAWNSESQYDCDYSRQDTVIVYKKPIVDFEIEKRADRTVYFYNHSQFGERHLWDLGDTISLEENPIHSYSQPDTYTITLSVWTDENCFDQKTEFNVVISDDNTDLYTYPNPFYDHFIVVSKEVLNTPVIRIFDLFGREVNTKFEIISERILKVYIINPRGDTFILQLVNNDKEFNYSIYRF
jgi:PKD repeat protein